MLGSERQMKILEYLKTNEFITLKQIVNEYYVSEATARRDLNELAKTGAIKRVFGGASLVKNPEEVPPLFLREREDMEEKTSLASAAATLVKDGDVLFLDGSSTIQCLVPFLAKFRDLLVITNGINVLNLCANLHIKCYGTGGSLLERSLVFIGNEAIRFVEDFNADLCFLSAQGLSEDGKFTDSSRHENELRYAFMKNSARTAFLMTKKKYGTKYVHTLCRTEDIDSLFMTGGIPTGLKFKSRGK